MKFCLLVKSFPLEPLIFILFQLSSRELEQREIEKESES